ncbi:type II secretion system F family protein [Tessaracoccus antarcticus]|nr:type II secretion system F family protein [Tessaracoccus antarcticus]
MTLVVVLFTLAATVGVGYPAERGLARLHPRPSRRSRGGVAFPALAGLVLLLTALLGLRVAGWGVAGAAMAATASWVISGMRAQRNVVRERDETARAVRTVSLLLQSGQIPTRALEDAAADCVVLAPAALTGRLGGDVAAALREAGMLPGRDGLTRMAAAWCVSERTGAPIAAILTRVSETLRQERHLAAVVAAELAAARASGRVMALLPFVAIGLGVVVGADPLGFLFGSWLGEAVFVAGTLLAAVGVVWTENISRNGSSAPRGQP